MLETRRGQALPSKDDCRARVRPPMALAVAEVLGELDRDLEEVCPTWSSVASSSPVLSWTGKTEAKTSPEGDNLASALPAFWEWGGGGSRVPVKNILGCRELSGVLEGILVLPASLSANLEVGSLVDSGKIVSPSSKENRLSVAREEGISAVKEGGASVAMEGESSVATGDGALVSTVGRVLVARGPETSVTKEDGGVSVAREEGIAGIPLFLEPEASVSGEDGASVTR